MVDEAAASAVSNLAQPEPHSTPAEASETQVAPTDSELERRAGAPGSHSDRCVARQAQPAAMAAEGLASGPDDLATSPPAPRGDEQAGPGQALDLLADVEVEAAVELGRATLSIAEVMKLGPGSIVHLNKMLGDPADLVIRDHMIARGEVVVLDDRFGLRVTEVGPPAKS